MAYQGINFRATAGYVTDGAGETYSLGEVYPTTRGGLTFGWSTSTTSNSRDRGTTSDRRLAGLNFVSNVAPKDFKIDLPSTGAATIRLALGDLGSASTNRVQLIDGTTVFATISASAGVANFLDASGANWVDSAWPGSNVAVSHTFTTTTFIVRVGDGVAANNSSIAHVSFNISVAPVSVSSDLAAAYAISETINSSLAAAYSVIAQISADLTGSYTMVSADSVSADLSATYGINAGVSGDLAGAYYMLASVSKDLAAAYAAASAGFFVTDQFMNNTETLWVPGQSVAWTWTVGGRPGSMTGKTVVDGTATLDVDYRLHLSGLPVGAGKLDAAMLGATPAQDALYAQYGTVT